MIAERGWRQVSNRVQYSVLRRLGGERKYISTELATVQWGGSGSVSRRDRQGLVTRREGEGSVTRRSDRGY